MLTVISFFWSLSRKENTLNANMVVTLLWEKKKKKKNSLFAVIFFHTVVNMLAKSKKMDVKSQVYYPVWNITGLWSQKSLGRKEQSPEPGGGKGLHKETADRPPLPEGLDSRHWDKCYTSTAFLIQISCASLCVSLYGKGNRIYIQNEDVHKARPKVPKQQLICLLSLSFSSWGKKIITVFLSVVAA